MTRLTLWLTTTLASLLEPHDRDAVVGDLLDSGENFFQGLRGVIGLIMRRQLGLWKQWYPWAALIGIVAIAGTSLSQFVYGIEKFYSMTTVGAYFASVEHFNGKDWTTLPMAHDIVFFVCFAAVIIIWSWVSGFALSALSGRTAWLMGPLLYLTVINFARIASASVRLHGKGAPPVPIFLLDRLEPFTIVQTLLFFVPVMIGMRSGLRRKFLTVRWTLAISALTFCFTIVLIGMSAWSYRIDTVHGTIGVYDAPALNLSTILVSWPLLYMFAVARTHVPDGST